MSKVIHLESSLSAPPLLGFGSNVTHNVSLLWGLNQLFGQPYSQSQICDISTLNFFESADNNQVYWGIGTGVGDAALIYGNLVWVDIDGKYLGNFNPTPFYVVTAVGKMDSMLNDKFKSKITSVTSMQGDVEIYIAQNIIRHSETHAEPFPRLLHEKITLPFYAQNYSSLNRVIWEVNQYGEFDFFREVHRSDVMDKFVKISKPQALFAGFSSVGPFMFALTNSEQKAKDIQTTLSGNLHEHFSDFHISAAGQKIKLVSLE